MKKSLTRENKKQEILDYIIKISNINDLFKISIDELKENLKDENYDEEGIGDLIDDLISAKLLVKKSLNIEIVYEKKNEKNIFKKWDKFILPFDNSLLNLITYILLIMGFYYFKKEYLELAFIIPIVLGIGKESIKKTIYYTKDFLPFFKQINTTYISINIILSLIIIFFAYIFSEYILKDGFTTTILLTALGIGVTLGNLFYHFVIKKRK